MLDDMFDEPGRWLALLGVICGIAGGLIMGYLLSGLRDEPWNDSRLPALALGLIYIAPFLFALAVFPLRDNVWRGALWAGAGFTGVLTVMTTWSGVSLVMAPGGVLLLYGGLQEMGAVPDWREASISVIPLILACAVVVIGVASYFMLYRTTDPVCWGRAIVDGRPVWEVSHMNTNQPMTISSAGGRCAGDHITNAEARSSITVWAAGGPLILLAAYLCAALKRLLPLQGTS